MKRINVTRSSMPSYEEYCEEIRKLWDNRWLSNRGVEHREFEKELCDFLECENISLFANGHVALEVTIDSFDFPKGSEVVTTPYTHCSTTHSIVRNGLKPVFVDVEDKYLTIDPIEVEKHITNKTVAIVATHVYGFPCQVKEIEAIAKKYNLKVIYDAAHAFGVRINGESITKFGDAAMISCHATKVFHTIEGGITVFNDEEPYKKVDQLTNFGFVSPEQVDYVTTNARMNEFEAAMGLCNLRHINEDIEKRRISGNRYFENLSNIEGIRLIKPEDDLKWNYAYFPVIFDGYKHDRNQIQKKLEENEIYARKYFYPLTSELNCYIREYGKNTPVAKYAADRVLTLPMYSELTIEDVDRICEIILN